MVGPRQRFEQTSDFWVHLVARFGLYICVSHFLGMQIYFCHGHVLGFLSWSRGLSSSLCETQICRGQVAGVPVTGVVRPGISRAVPSSSGSVRTPFWGSHCPLSSLRFSPLDSVPTPQSLQRLSSKCPWLCRMMPPLPPETAILNNAWNSFHSIQSHLFFIFKSRYYIVMHVYTFLLWLNDIPS